MWPIFKKKAKSVDKIAPMLHLVDKVAIKNTSKELKENAVNNK